MRAGLAYTWAHPDLVLAMGLAFVVGTFGFNYQVTIALMAREVFDLGAEAFGLLSTSFAVGSLTGALLSTRRSVRPRQRFLVISAVVFGLFTVVAGLMPGFVSFAVMLVPTGAAALVFSVANNSFVQLGVDPQMRGRVMALYFMCFMGGTPVGAPLIGWISEHLGAPWGLILGGAVCVVAGLGAGVWLAGDGGCGSRPGSPRRGCGCGSAAPAARCRAAAAGGRGGRRRAGTGSAGRRRPDGPAAGVPSSHTPRGGPGGAMAVTLRRRSAARLSACLLAAGGRPLLTGPVRSRLAGAAIRLRRSNAASARAGHPSPVAAVRSRWSPPTCAGCSRQLALVPAGAPMARRRALGRLRRRAHRGGRLLEVPHELPTTPDGPAPATSSGCGCSPRSRTPGWRCRPDARPARRLFFAVDPPEEARADLDRALDRCAAPGAPRAGSRPSAGTSRCCSSGTVPADRVPPLVAAAAPAVAAAPADDPAAGRGGRFGSLRRPQVAWAGLDGDVARWSSSPAGWPTPPGRSACPSRTGRSAPHLTARPLAPRAAGRRHAARPAGRLPRAGLAGDRGAAAGEPPRPEPTYETLAAWPCGRWQRATYAGPERGWSRRWPLTRRTPWGPAL